MARSVEGSCFFERRLRGRVALRVRGTALLAREVETVQQAGQAPDTVAHAVAALDVLAQVHQAPGADLVPLRPGPAQNVGLEGGLLPLAQPLRTTRAGSVMKAVRSLRVEAQHGIAQEPDASSRPGVQASARVMPASALAMARPSRALLAGEAWTACSPAGSGVRPRQRLSASPPPATQSPQPA